MNVLLSAFSSDARRGSESLIGHHYARMVSERHRVTFMTCKPTTVDFTHRLEALDIGERDLNEVGRKDLLAWEAAQFPVARRILREEEIDLIHRATPISVNDSTLLSYLKPRFLLGPLVVSGEAPESFRPYMWREFEHRKGQASLLSQLQPLDRAASLGAATLLRLQNHFRRAEAIFVGTAHTADAVPEPWRRKCVPLPCIAVESDEYLPREIETARPLILYAGRLTGHKGLELLLRALAVIKDEVDFEARIVGGGTPWYEGFLHETARELGLEHRVSFVKPIPREELKELIQACTVFCFPSISDTYGVALLEAMSCQRACVVADTGGPREIVEDGCGIKLTLESPEQYIRDYAHAVRTLIREPALRAEMGGRARELVVSRNRWEKIAETVHQVYDEIGRKG